MYSYKFQGNSKKPSETFIGDTAPQGFIAFKDGQPVDWTKFDYVNNELVEIIVPPPDPVIPPTPEELQRQAIDTLNYDVFPKTKQLKELYASAYLGVDLKSTDGTPKTQEAIDLEVKTRRDFIKVQYDALRDDTLAKQEAILNG